jgi:hypothetical protein
MKKNLLVASLLVALMAPAAQAVGLVPPIKTEGGWGSRLSLQSNPRSIRIINGYKTGTRTDSRWFTTHTGPTHQQLNLNGNGTTGGNPPSVPEPEGIALGLAAGILGFAFTGYTSIQRRRVHGAA